MYAPIDPDDRDMRRRHLAKRLVSHQARTQTIYGFTGFTRTRLATMRKRWGVKENARQRGPSPTSAKILFRSMNVRSEAAAAAVALRVFADAHGIEMRVLAECAGFESGERLCDIFESLQACFPGGELEFEQFLLLAKGLAAGNEIQVGSCTACGATILLDLLGTRRILCSPCLRRFMSGGGAKDEVAGGDEGGGSGDAGPGTDAGDKQGKLF